MRLSSTRPAKAAVAAIDSAIGEVMGARQAAAFCGPARFQFQGNSSSIRLAG
jgi:hypothetical protein